MRFAPRPGLCRPLLLALLAASSTTAACGGAALSPSHADAPPLPLKTIRFYDTGVAYFERSGAVSDAAALPVPAAHLDDALATLVVIGPDAQVTGLSFDSSPSSGMARARARLPVDPATPLDFREVLRAARGERVEITHASGVLRGRLIDVVDAPPPPPSPPAPPHHGDESPVAADTRAPAEAPFSVVIVGEDGAIARVASRDLLRVRPLDAAFAARIGEALDASGSRAAQVRRLLHVAATGKGTVTLGYVAETPLWRASYRLVLPPKGPAAIQGWALIHNDTDEDWRRVAVSLVNGRPDSFLFPLAAPRYARRTLVHPDEPLSTVPQLLSQTPDAMWGDNADRDVETLSMGDIGTIGHGSGSGSGQGYGSGHGRLGGDHSVASDLLQIGNLAELGASSGVAAGALFSYSPGAPLDLGAHGSALVPFLSRAIGAQPITFFASPTDAPRAALRFTNDTDQTLPPGTIAVFSGGGYAGESALDRLEPGERRFVTYGADLDVALTEGSSELRDVVRRVSFEHAKLEEHYVRTTRVPWTVVNRGATPRVIQVALQLKANSKIEGADDVDFDTASSKPIAVVRVGAASKVDKKMVLTEGLERFYPARDLDEKLLVRLRDAPELPAAEKAALGVAAARQKELEALRARLGEAREAVKGVEKDVERLREHLKALGDKGDRGGPNPLLTRILAAEDALAKGKKTAAGLEAEVNAKAASVQDALSALARKEGSAP